MEARRYTEGNLSHPVSVGLGEDRIRMERRLS